MELNVLKDNWIALTDGTKTNVTDVLDRPVSDIANISDGYQISIEIFMLLISYLNEVDEDKFSDFMQQPNNGPEQTIDQIIYYQPRENTKKLNKDHFIKRGSINCLCESCCMQSLITLSLFSSTAGKGYSPALFAKKLVMLKMGNTIREIIDNNKISQKYNFNQLFSTPFRIEFTNKSHAKCSMCNAETTCYSSFKREPSGKLDFPSSLPLVAMTTFTQDGDAEIYMYRKPLIPLEIISKINNGAIIPPKNVEPVIGDRILAYSVLFDKAKFISTTEYEFIFNDFNVESDVVFIEKCISSFHKGEKTKIQDAIYAYFENLMRSEEQLNNLAMKIFMQYIPDDLSRLTPTQQQLMAMAINKMRNRYDK